jgi:hypothetical protein
MVRVGGVREKQFLSFFCFFSLFNLAVFAWFNVFSFFFLLGFVNRLVSICLARIPSSACVGNGVAGSTPDHYYQSLLSVLRIVISWAQSGMTWNK